MDINDPIAHVAEDAREHLLRDHLYGTAEPAAHFAAEFDCAGCGAVGMTSVGIREACSMF